MQNLILYYSAGCNIIPPPGVAVNAADEALKLKLFDKLGCKHLFLTARMGFKVNFLLCGLPSYLNLLLL